MGNKSSKMFSSSASDSDADTFVADAIAKHPILIFSKSYCPYCRMAKTAIDTAGQSIPGYSGYKVYELEKMGAQGHAIQAALASRTGRRTVPNVFIAGVNVGGGDDVAALHRSDRLAPLLKDALSPPKTNNNNNNNNDNTPNDNASASSTETPMEFVKNAIATYPVLVFSKSWCPYCIAGKAAIAEAGQEVADFEAAKVFELDQMGTRGADIQSALADLTGRSTVPNVFIGGINVGGGDDVVGLHRSGVLKQMLAQAAVKLAATASSNGTPNANGAEQTKTLQDSQVEKPGVQYITLGAGCFWGVELAFQRVSGVVSTEVGYSNGAVERNVPLSYEEVCSGATGAAEVVRVGYDPNQVSLQELLKVWEGRHDITSVNRQGNDVGTQYRSAIFWEDESQVEAVEAWRTDAEARGLKVATEVARVERYNAAESYHQRYLEKKGQSADKGATERIRCYG